MPSGRSRDIPEPVRENPLEEELSFDLNDILMEDLYELSEGFPPEPVLEEPPA